MDLLLPYEQLLRVSEQMRAAAVNQDWDALAAFEQCYAAAVGNLPNADDAAVQRMDGPQRQRRAQVIRSILANDAVIRARTQPRLEELQRFLCSHARGRQLRQVYHAGD